MSPPGRGWRYPEALAPGNYERLVMDNPRLANLGNTQCENCHGPGSAHTDDDGSIAVSLRPEACVQCHDFLQQDQYAQWTRSAHADTTLPQLFPQGIDNPLCAGCHTTRGFVNRTDGVEAPLGEREQLSCQACHDPHAAPGANHYQVRVFGSARLPDGTNILNAGSSALCIGCHNVGETPEWVDQEHDPWIPPPQSSAPEMLTGVAGYTFGQNLDDSPHANLIWWGDSCVGCHMASSTDAGSSDFLSATMNEPIGEHTFQVRHENGTPDDPSDDFENVAACESCHGAVPRINGPADADYDGDGIAEGVQDEVQGLLDRLGERMIAAGLAWSDVAPYWGPAEGAELRAAVYNWSVVNNDGSRGIHNTARSVELLQLTYHELTGEQVPGAVLRRDNPPKAQLQARFAAERPLIGGLNWAHFVIPLAVAGLFAAIGYVVYVGVFRKDG